MSPQLQALWLLKERNIITGSGDLPRYLGFEGGDHIFRLTNGNEARVDLVLRRVGP